MNEWKVCKLGDISSFQEGYVNPSQKIPDYFGDEIKWVRANDLNNSYVYDTSRKLSDKGFKSAGKAAKLFKPNTVVISKSGTIGRLGIIKDFMCGNRATINIEAKDFNDIKFIFYFLKNNHNLLQDMAVGSVQKNLYIFILEDMDVYLPPISEQKAITAVLSSLDDKIDLLHRQNTTLEAMAETLFRQWFIEEAQEDWKEQELGELLTITSSKRIFYSEYVETGIPFYRSKEIIELHNSGSTRSELCISEERFNEIRSNYGIPIEGDILLTSVGTLGIPYRVRKGDVFYFKDGNLTWFKDFSSIPSIVVYCWLKSSVGKEQLDSITIGSTQAALTISGLKSIKLMIPPKNNMEFIENNFLSIYDKVDANQSQMRSLEKLRDNLLPKLMSGEIKVAI